MDRAQLKTLLQQVAGGSTDIDTAVERLATMPVDDLGFAHVDTHRALRTGDPEVVYGEGKTAVQIATILGRIAAAGHDALATRVSHEKATAVLAVLAEHGFGADQVRHHVAARLVHVRVRAPAEPLGRICVVCAGTSDLPMAEEAALTAEALGARVDRVTDVGVAGIHRVLRKTDELRRANVVVVVAGMEGALASVVAGLVDVPVIAVPTSVGYGANFGGLAALLGMLNSCAAGVSVVNIDNGFGAALQAARINRLAAGAPR